MKISEALVKLGYKEFIVRGNTFDGIEWVEQPDTFPTEQEIIDMIAQLEVLEQQEQDAAKAARESALNKLSALGLTEDEIKALVGA